MAAAARGQDQFPWQPNLETAQQLAGQTNRLVLVHFWAPWCQPCLRLDKEVFSHTETAAALNPNFVCVKLNVDETPGTARLYGVSSLPTDVILSPAGRLVAQIQSPPTAVQYIAQMNQAAAGSRDLARKSQVQVAGNPPRTPDPAFAAGASGPAGGPPAVNTTPQLEPTQPAYSNDRYAEYLREHSGAPQAPPANSQPGIQPQTPPVAGFNPPTSSGAPAASPGSMIPNEQYTARASYQLQTQLPQLPPGCPPLGLDGYCPITLSERQQWALGDTHWGAIHRGRTYLFVGPEEQKKFLSNPDLYAPVLSGNDPVIALDQRATAAGRREFGITFEHRVYLFADEASRQKFEQNPKRYANEVLQAMR
ncbi:MAG TPA: thioredoxin family protein [Pirellulales bacterium]|jgi:thiol-disulfide isomerase/thioredoxin/YHS domain-containing protein|nr:thioredoxin family protein [Pirellulales bacterium]